MDSYITDEEVIDFKERTLDFVEKVEKLSREKLDEDCGIETFTTYCKLNLENYAVAFATAEKYRKSGKTMNISDNSKSLINTSLTSWFTNCSAMPHFWDLQYEGFNLDDETVVHNPDMPLRKLRIFACVLVVVAQLSDMRPMEVFSKYIGSGKKFRFPDILCSELIKTITKIS